MSGIIGKEFGLIQNLTNHKLQNVDMPRVQFMKIVTNKIEAYIFARTNRDQQLLYFSVHFCLAIILQYNTSSTRWVLVLSKKKKNFRKVNCIESSVILTIRSNMNLMCKDILLVSLSLSLLPYNSETCKRLETNQTHRKYFGSAIWHSYFYFEFQSSLL